MKDDQREQKKNSNNQDAPVENCECHKSAIERHINTNWRLFSGSRNITLSTKNKKKNAHMHILKENMNTMNMGKKMSFKKELTIQNERGKINIERKIAKKNPRRT